MDIIKAAILGAVQGVTEFLPISSTGHLILASRLLHIPQIEFVKSFEIIIQLGSILAVAALYWRSLILDLKILKKVIAAFIPSALIGLIMYKFVKKVLLGNTGIVLWALFLGGIVLIIFELLHRDKKDPDSGIKDISYLQAFLIGIFQSVAMIPGVSRSAATVIGGLALGLKRKTIVEFSFLLAIPTMLAATVLDLLKSSGPFSSDQMVSLGVGFAVSFIIAIAGIKFLLYFIKNNNFISFGIYRCILALLFWTMIRR